jgi:hypothetical protein
MLEQELCATYLFSANTKTTVLLYWNCWLQVRLMMTDVSWLFTRGVRPPGFSPCALMGSIRLAWLLTYVLSSMVGREVPTHFTYLRVSGSSG